MCLYKKIILVIVSLFIALLTTRAQGQEYLDTIRLQMPNEATIELLMNYGEKKSFKENVKDKRGKERVRYVNTQQNLSRIEMKKALDSFLKRWEVLGITDLDEKNALEITDSDRRISIEEIQKSIFIYFPEDKQLALSIKGKHKLALLQENYTAHIYFDKVKQLEELAEYDFATQWKEVDKKIEKKAKESKRKYAPLSVWLSVNQLQNVSLDDFSLKHSLSKGYVGIFMGIGLENVKGDWNGSFNLGMSLRLSNQRYYTQRIDLNYEFMYNFSGQGKTVNHWLDFGYYWDFNRGTQEENWWGPSLGFLVKRKGDFFEKDMFRLGVSKEFESITITPRIYFTDVFKDVYPAINILLRF